MSAQKNTDFDLLLELFMISRDPTRCYTQDELAAFLGCSQKEISRIEIRALAKCRALARARELETEAPAPRPFIRHAFLSVSAHWAESEYEAAA